MRFCFDCETCLNYPFLNFFSVENLKPFKVKVKPKTVQFNCSPSRIIVGRLLNERKLKLRDQYGEGAIMAAVQGGHFTLAQKVAEEITRRGLCLRDYSRNLRENRGAI